MEQRKNEDKRQNPFAILKDLFTKKTEHNPLKDAQEMADAFEEGLRRRLDVIVGENDSQHVRFQISPGYIDETKESQLSVRVFMAPDQMRYPQGVALQIHNAFWETENDKQFKRKFELKNLGKNTIELFRNTLGKIKITDKTGNLTTQKKYIFK